MPPRPNDRRRVGRPDENPAARRAADDADPSPPAPVPPRLAPPPPQGLAHHPHPGRLRPGRRRPVGPVLKDSELSGFTGVLDHLNWWWVPPAFAVEIGSYVAFAAMQWNLLMAGHLRPPWWTLLKLTFGSQALTNSLPIGNAVATVYGFRWFRRFGADNTLAVWALAGTLVATVVSLSLVAVIGLALATSQGASSTSCPCSSAPSPSPWPSVRSSSTSARCTPCSRSASPSR